jgi:hypothetical protein
MRSRTCVLAASITVALASFSFADVTGKVKLDGKPPAPKEINMDAVKECAAMHADPVMDDSVVVSKDGGLANVVVSIKTDDPEALGGSVPKEPAVLDQKGCMYNPHVLAMMKGQELMVKNDDAFLHNVQSTAQINPGFNKAQSGKNNGEKVDSPKAAENIKVKCQVHPWMAAWIVVLDHPFFSVTKPDGSFDIKGLPDGDYTVQAWHEVYGKQEGKVTVKDGKGELNLTFKAVAAAGDHSNIKLASYEAGGSPAKLLSTATSASDSCPECDAAAATGTPVVATMAVKKD